MTRTNDGVRQSNLKRWQDPAYRARMSEISKRPKGLLNLPPKGTPDRKLYDKIRWRFGAKAARIAIVTGAIG